MLSSEKIARLQSFLFGATGLICMLYALLVVFTGQPDPMPLWLLGSVGLLSAVLIFSKFHHADTVSVQQSTDELFKHNAAIAHRFGFWGALLLYPFFGFLIATDVISLTLAFPIMGTLTAAAYLL